MTNNTNKFIFDTENNDEENDIDVSELIENDNIFAQFINDAKKDKHLF